MPFDENGDWHDDFEIKDDMGTAWAVKMFFYIIFLTLLAVGAFLIRAGSLGKIFNYDILIEDVVRSLTVGYCLQWILSQININY